MKKIHDLVILLSGNSYIAFIDESQRENLNKLICDSITSNEEFLVLQDGNRRAVILTKSILGWYFKPHEKSVQEKCLDAVNKMVEPPEDNWKNSED